MRTGKTRILVLFFVLAMVGCSYNKVMDKNMQRNYKMPKLQTPLPKHNSQQKFEILVYNVKLLPIVPAENKWLRASYIVDFLKPTCDIIVLCEAYDPQTSKILIDKLAHEGYGHVSKPIGGSILTFHGGVRVVSRWPIEKEVSYIYPQSVGFDSLADKGVVYVSVRKNQKLYHIFASHLQAGYSFNRAKGRELKKLQWRQLGDFIKKQAITKKEMVFAAGDFNLDFYTNWSRKTLMESWPVLVPPIDPEGKERVYSNLKGHWLDYVLIHKEHPNPIWSSLRSIAPKSPDGKDLSDHYAVLGTFIFENKAPIYKTR